MLLLIDNIDSFTHNLARYFVELGESVTVVRNDTVTIEDIKRIAPTRIVISPGPCKPENAGISLDVVRTFAGHIPMLGVCLGHQAIGQVFSASIVSAQEIKHGKVSLLHHTGKGLFEKLPDTFNVTRYHSLVVSGQSLPKDLVCDSWCINEDGSREIMSLRHSRLPIWGVQFHPESLLTEHGYDLLRTFLRLSSTKQHDPTSV